MANRYGSDLIVDAMKSLGIEYAAINPGSSFRGLHDSPVNYDSGKNPKMITWGVPWRLQRRRAGLLTGRVCGGCVSAQGQRNCLHRSPAGRRSSLHQ